MIRSLMLVLDGNIPRFPWEPSTTMLTYRLERHYRAIRCHTGTDRTSLAARRRRRTSPGRDGRAPHQIFAHPGEP